MQLVVDIAGKVSIPVTGLTISGRRKNTFNDDVLSWLRDGFWRFSPVERVLVCTGDISDEMWMSSSTFNIGCHVGTFYLIGGGYICMLELM